MQNGRDLFVTNPLTWGKVSYARAILALDSGLKKSRWRHYRAGSQCKPPGTSEIRIISGLYNVNNNNIFAPIFHLNFLTILLGRSKNIFRKAEYMHWGQTQLNSKHRSWNVGVTNTTVITVLIGWSTISSEWTVSCFAEWVDPVDIRECTWNTQHYASA